MVSGVRPGGLVLDLQVIRPNPRVELDGRAPYEIDGEPLFRKADAATAAVDALIASGRLDEQAVDDPDVVAILQLRPRHVEVARAERQNRAAAGRRHALDRGQPDAHVLYGSLELRPAVLRDVVDDGEAEDAGVPVQGTVEVGDTEI